jgi:predicted acyl esterase
MALMRRAMALIGIAGALVFAPAAQAAIPSVFGGLISCSVNATDGVRECGGLVHSPVDGAPIDVNVAFPPDPSPAPDGPYPLVMTFHGWGGSKIPFGDPGTRTGLRRWTSQGYAAFSMSDRGWGESCGHNSANLLTDPNCLHGYIRLMDTRYEVRDAQEFAGQLADEDRVDPQLIGATGPSYGGGLSMALAALGTRKMMPDGSLVPWTSPVGSKPMRIAAAAPEIPWTDLAYALAPNGRTLDYTTDNPYGPPIGVLKQSFVGGLYALGQALGTYAPPGTDPDADLTTWFDRVNAGEPYEGDPIVSDMIDELTTHHSSYYIDDSQAPAPLLISNGWTDDLFPPDEALRFYNRTRAHHPGSDISLYFLDYGHQRGQNKPEDVARLQAAQNAWFAHFLAGGAAPFEGVTVLTTTCPKTAPSAGPFTAPTWPELAPGEVRLDSADPQTIVPGAGDPSIGQAFDPISGPGACAQADGADQTGTATYRLPPAPPSGYTLMGSPTVVAHLNSPGPHSQIASRLLDVGPDGKETLVARGLYRATSGQNADAVFQLHPNAYRFEAGHVAKLELLPADPPYSRATNGQTPVTMSDLELRLPVREQPGSGGGFVTSPEPKVIPPGSTPAPGINKPGRARARLAPGILRVRGNHVLLRVRCPKTFRACHEGQVIVQAARSAFGQRAHLRARRFLVAKGRWHARGGQTKSLRLGLRRGARLWFAHHRKLRTLVTVSSAENSRHDRHLRSARRARH